MKLNDVLAVISGGTTIRIYADNKVVFRGHMAGIKKSDFIEKAGAFLDNEVYRINTINNVITIAC